MFGLYFGRWLLENNAITKEKIGKLSDESYPGFMHELVEKGYLTRDEAERHLSSFKKKYRLTDENVCAISSGELERIVPLFISFDAAEAIRENLKAFQLDNGLSDGEMEELREEAETDWFFPDYIQTDPALYNRFVKLTIENIMQYISKRLILKRARQTQRYAFKHLACQELKGAHHIFLGFSGDEKSLTAIAGRFAKKEFPELDKRAYEGVCEFINCVNGLYASQLSFEKLFMKLSLPSWHTDQEIISNSALYCLPLVIDDAESELIFSFDNDMSIQ